MVQRTPPGDPQHSQAALALLTILPREDSKVHSVNCMGWDMALASPDQTLQNLTLALALQWTKWELLEVELSPHQCPYGASLPSATVTSGCDWWSSTDVALARIRDLAVKHLSPAAFLVQTSLGIEDKVSIAMTRRFL